jgi:hypothetical protein
VNIASLVESLSAQQNRDLGRFCLQSADRAYRLEQMADDDESRFYWRMSARRWIARFWEVTVAP